MSSSQCNSVPESITFGKKILTIPTLKEMGIPLAGLSIIEMNPQFYEKRYSGGCWINRGDHILTYKFRFFNTEKPSFLSKFGRLDQMWDYTKEIVSPISGLLIGTRDEDAINFTSGLQYQWCQERVLPIILVPNDEPKPEKTNFYNYDSLATQLYHYFYFMPIRQHSKINAERLGTFIKETDRKDVYEEYRNSLDNRDSESFREYDIREITKDDYGLIDNIQQLRANDLILREKLLHISKEFNESI